jgi:chromosome partitioning protein
MRTWAFVSQKGGSGKSTLAVHLAVLAEEEGETVAIIDLDPQANVVAWHEVRGTNQPNVFPGAPEQLTKMVEAAETLGITLVLIDTPSKVDDTALAAIRAADLIVVPTRAGLFDVAALKDTVKLLEMAEKLGAATAVINDFDPDKKRAVVAEASVVLEGFGIPVSPAHIPNRPLFETALKKGKGITETKAKGPGTNELRALWGHLDAGKAQAARKKTAS